MISIGAQGVQGSFSTTIGPQGVQGSIGESVSLSLNIGAQGLQGVQGSKGAQGAQSIATSSLQGVQGDNVGLSGGVVEYSCILITSPLTTVIDNAPSVSASRFILLDFGAFFSTVESVPITTPQTLPTSTTATSWPIPRELQLTTLTVNFKDVQATVSPSQGLVFVEVDVLVSVGQGPFTSIGLNASSSFSSSGVSSATVSTVLTTPINLQQDSKLMIVMYIPFVSPRVTSASINRATVSASIDYI